MFLVFFSFRSRHNSDSSTFHSRTNKSPHPQSRSPLSRRPRWLLEINYFNSNLMSLTSLKSHTSAQKYDVAPQKPSRQTYNLFHLRKGNNKCTCFSPLLLRFQCILLWFTFHRQTKALWLSVRSWLGPLWQTFRPNMLKHFFFFFFFVGLVTKPSHLHCFLSQLADTDSAKCCNGFCSREEHFICREVLTWCRERDSSTGLMTPDKPQSHLSAQNLTDMPGAHLGWRRESCTFLPDEAQTKQKVMTCEVVLTVAAGRLPTGAARLHSCGTVSPVP